MFDLANKLIGDIIKRGKAGEKFTVLQVTTLLAGRISEIETVLKGWEVKI